MHEPGKPFINNDSVSHLQGRRRRSLPLTCVSGRRLPVTLLPALPFPSPSSLLLVKGRSVLSHTGRPLLVGEFVLISASPTFGTAESSSSSSFNHEETPAFRSLA